MIKMLLLPIAFKLAPNLMGTLALNTMVNKAGHRRMGVPMPVLKSVAKLAHETVVNAAKVESRLARKRMPGALALTRDYANHLEYCANAIREIVAGEIDQDTAAMRYPQLVKIITQAQART